MMGGRRVARRTARRTVRRTSSVEAPPAATPSAAAPTPAGPAPQDDLAQIQQLAAMKEQGLLTEEEFEAKKKQILGI